MFLKDISPEKNNEFIWKWNPINHINISGREGNNKYMVKKMQIKRLNSQQVEWLSWADYPDAITFIHLVIMGNYPIPCISLEWLSIHFTPILLKHLYPLRFSAGLPCVTLNDSTVCTSPVSNYSYHPSIWPVAHIQYVASFRPPESSQ